MTDDEFTEHSPAGLSAPDCEVEDERIACPVCGDERPASEMGISVDKTEKNHNDAVLAVERQYVCDEDCAMELMFGRRDE